MACDPRVASLEEAMGTLNSYIPLDVWQYHGDKLLVCFRCFKVIPGDRFCVQSADLFHLPISEEALENSRQQFFELLGEERPNLRSPSFDSIEEAIEHHLAEFVPISE